MLNEEGDYLSSSTHTPTHSVSLHAVCIMVLPWWQVQHIWQWAFNMEGHLEVLYSLRGVSLSHSAVVRGAAVHRSLTCHSFYMHTHLHTHEANDEDNVRNYFGWTRAQRKCILHSSHVSATLSEKKKKGYVVIGVVQSRVHLLDPLVCILYLKAN